MTKLIRRKTKMIYPIIGRIDSSSAERFEQALMKAYETNGILELNAKGLEYISSAGLRVLLKLSKKQGQLSIFDVCSEIYEIFEMTGFTEIMDIKKAFRFVSVKDLEIIGKGGHGHVYRLSDDMIIKVYHDNATLETIDQERQYAKNAFVHGVPSPIAFDVVQTEEGYGVILELAGAQTLSSFLMKNPDQVDEYGVKFGNLIKQLNQTEGNPELYGKISDIYRERIEKCRLYLKEEEIDKLLMLLDSIPEKNGMVHGDYHPNNVMVDKDGELLLIDMADISRGNELFDIGGAYTCMVQAGQRNPAVVEAVTGLEATKSFRLFDIMVSTYYNIDNPSHLEIIKKRLAAFGLFRSITSIGMETDNIQLYREALIQKGREYLFPAAEGIAKLFSM